MLRFYSLQFSRIGGIDRPFFAAANHAATAWLAAAKTVICFADTAKALAVLAVSDDTMKMSVDAIKQLQVQE